jgi:hypothetical protein
MSQGNAYRRIEATREFEWSRETIIVEFDPLHPRLQAVVRRLLPKQDGGRGLVPHRFVCNKLAGGWRCESLSHSVEQPKGPRTSRIPSGKIRRDWYESIVKNCEAFERKMEQEHQAQKQIFDSDGGKIEIASPCELNGAIVTFWHSHGWLVREHVAPSGQLWVWPETESASIDALQLYIQSKLASRRRFI